MNKFEQLIEYVINDEEQKARELFHDIVVAKSRQIYEDIMSEEEVDEAEEHDDEEQVDEGDMGGDAADDLIDDVEAEEQDDMSMEAEGDDEEEVDVEMDADVEGGDDHHADVGGEEELEDRVMDLEDKLDELMAEFESLMGGDEAGMDDMGDGDDFGADEGGDAIEMDDTAEMMPEMGAMPMEESVSLKAVPAPKHGDNGANNKSPVAANAGAKGPVGNTVKPVKTGGEMGGHHDAAPYKNTTKDLIGKVGNTPAQGTQQPKAAPAPVKTQASGVNTKSVVPGKRG
jgi:hypothetical protein